MFCFLAGKAGKKGKKKGSDSDSDEDWTKNKKSTGTAKKAGGGGGKGKGSGYISQITLSPELAAIVGCEKMARHEVEKKIWEIIKEKNLYVSFLFELIDINLKNTKSEEKFRILQ